MVVERALGRKLKPDEEVNHINGLKFDNSNSNLFVSNHEYHTAWHQRCKERFGTWHPPVVRDPSAQSRKAFYAAVSIDPSEREEFDYRNIRRSKPATETRNNTILESRDLANIFRECIGLVCDA
jgi:hypothetical protein